MTIITLTSAYTTRSNTYWTRPESPRSLSGSTLLSPAGPNDQARRQCQSLPKRDGEEKQETARRPKRHNNNARPTKEDHARCAVNRAHREHMCTLKYKSGVRTSGHVQALGYMHVRRPCTGPVLQCTKVAMYRRHMTHNHGYTHTSCWMAHYTYDMPCDTTLKVFRSGWTVLP